MTSDGYACLQATLEGSQMRTAEGMRQAQARAPTQAQGMATTPQGLVPPTQEERLIENVNHRHMRACGPLTSHQRSVYIINDDGAAC